MNQKNNYVRSSTKNKSLKGDAILIALLLSVSLFAFILLHLNTNEVKGQYIEIYVDNSLYGKYSLNENQTITIKEHSTVEISNGAVCIKQSDCNDKVCEKTGYISNVNESIICLPNRIIITVVSEKSNDTSIDAIIG